ncbi:hypothetical protein D3C77_531470 [compost metagenome]
MLVLEQHVFVTQQGAELGEGLLEMVAIDATRQQGVGSCLSHVGILHTWIENDTKVPVSAPERLALNGAWPVSVLPRVARA